jgi:hypothetical protein
MALVNDHFLKLPNNYLFADIAKKVNIFKAQHPKTDVISLGIGDVTQPLCPAVIEALHRATDEMATTSGFRGYGPEQGYDFLRDAILKHDFLARGIHLDRDEIFVNDGAKSDTGNFQELIRWDNSIAVTDPIYPVYIDSNVMIGRAGIKGEDGHWSNVIYLPCTAENGFVPELPSQRVDVIYLCYPNNPTGTALTREQQEELFRQVWDDYPEIRNKRDRFKKIREDPYYNALQIKYAYAVTCHKAQGGQWSRVFIDQGYVTEEMLSPDYFRWLYTALTRATERVYLINWPSSQVEGEEGSSDSYV